MVHRAARVSSRRQYAANAVTCEFDTDSRHTTIPTANGCAYTHTHTPKSTQTRRILCPATDVGLRLCDVPYPAICKAVVRVCAHASVDSSEEAQGPQEKTYHLFGGVFPACMKSRYLICAIDRAQRGGGGCGGQRVADRHSQLRSTTKVTMQHPLSRT